MVNVKLAEDEYFNSYRFKLYPTKEQAKQLDRYIELSRYIYNWALNEQIVQNVEYLSDNSDFEYLTKMELERRFTELRNSEGHEFLKEMPHISERLAIWRLMAGIEKYKDSCNNYPVFKTKKDKSDQSFSTRTDRMFFNNNYLFIEGFYENPIDIRFNTGWQKDYKRNKCPKFYNAVITRQNDNTYWIAFGVIEKKRIKYFEENNINSLNRAIGIDLNKDKRIQLSTGQVFYGPNLDKENKRLKRAMRKVCKDTKRFKVEEKTNPDAIKSKRSIKRLRKYQKISKHIANISDNFIQTATKEIIKMRPSMIVMEDLRVQNMHEASYIGKKIRPDHCNFGKIRITMEQKCNMYNIPFKLAPVGYLSTQLCSNCRSIKSLGASRTYKCPVCGMIMDRDLNAAINLENLAYDDTLLEFVLD